MDELRARFSLDDDMSSGFDSIADSIDELVESLEQVESASESAFEGLESASETASSVDGVAESASSAGDAVDDMGNAMSSAGDSAGDLAGQAESASAAMGEFSGEASEMAGASAEFAASAQEARSAASEMGSSLSEAGSTGASAIETIASAIGAAAIASKLQEIASSAHEMTEAFSGAQKTITNATGASGAALTSMSDSMLEAWAGNDDSLQDVAGAVGEINTRMGYTGEILTDTTAKFLDYADITGQNVVGSVRNVTQAMNQWGIAQSDVGSVMDKLAYAGQISGASVSELTNTVVRGGAAFQNAGLDIDSTIGMLADFELAGIQSSSAIMAMRTAVSKFSKEGVDAKTGIQDAVREIASMGNESQATAKAIEVFGSRAGQQLGLAIRNGTVSVDTFNGSLEKARGTLQITAKAGESLEEKWQKATNSLQSGFMQGLAPGIDAISSGMAEAATSVGDFLRENTGVSQVLAGMATGIGVVTAAITAYVAAMTAAKAASSLFAEGGLLAGLSLGPLAAVAAGIGLVTTAFLSYADASKRAYDEEAQYTSSTHKHMEALEGLESRYQAMQEAGQGNTDAARDLNVQIQQEKQWLDQNGMSVEQYIAKNDALIESHKSLSEEMSNARNEVTEGAEAHAALIGRLEDVSGVSGKAARSSEDMAATYGLLEESLGGLPVTLDEVSSSSENATKSIVKSAMVKDLTKAIKQGAEANAKYTEENAKLQKASESLEEQIQDAEDNKAKAADNKRKAVEQAATADMRAQEQNEKTAKSLSETNAEYQVATDELEKYKEQKKAVDAAIEENNQNMQASNQAYQQALSAYEGVDQGLRGQAEAAAVASMAYDSVADKLTTLTQQYDQMTQALMQNYQGQFGAFDKATANQEATASKWIQSLQSQAQYWADYDANSQVVTDAITARTEQTGQDFSNLIDYLNSGTPEAAGLVQDLASKTGEELNSALDEAEGYVTQMEQNQKGAAENFASVQSDLKGKIEEIKGDVESFISDLNGMSDEAKAAGADLMNGFLDGLTNGMGDSASLSDQMADSFNSLMEFDAGDDGGTITKTVEGDTEPLKQEAASAKEEIESTPAEAPIDGNTAQEEAAAEGAKGKIESDPAEVEITGNADQVEQAADGAVANAESKEAEIPVTADGSQVQSEVESAASGASGREVKITITADASQAESAISNIQSKASGLNPKVTISETGSSEVISQLHSIESTANSINPVIHVREEGVAAVQAEINSIQGKTVTITVNKVVNETKAGHAAGTTFATTSSYIAGEEGPELIARRTAGYANGTTNSDDFFIAGENGPELIKGAQGSTVFPTEETAKLVDVLNSKQQPLQVFPNADGGVPAPQANQKESGGEKHIVIDINGGGSLAVSGNSQMDKEQVLSLLQENMKPVLMQIIQNEIYEEGDLSYDY